MATFSKRTVFHIYTCTLSFLLLLSHVYSASLGLYDTEDDTANRIARLAESGLFSESRTERRADYLPVICKKMGIACEDDLMSLWTRPKRTVITHRMAGKRAELPVLCKKMGVACEDDLMGLWLRMMPDRHPVQV